VTFNWSVSSGTISSGQGTPSITVDTTGLGGQTVTATVEIGGLPPECDRARSCSFTVMTPPLPECTIFDQYNDLRFNDEKARLDNFAIQLQQQPDATGYYAIWGSCEGEGQRRADRAIAYLVNTRGIDASRIKAVVDPNCRETLTVELHICPPNATPKPANSATVTPCPQCRRARGRRPARRGTHRRRGGREEEE